MENAEKWLIEYLKNQPAESEKVPRQVVQWKPLDKATYKINVDATTFAGAGTGLGVVVRDKNGVFCCAGVRRTRIQWTSELAELQAIKFGLEIAVEKGFVPGEIESDCLGAVQQIEKEETSMAEEGAESEKVREMIDSLNGLMGIQFSVRESTRATHIFAHI
ncbi:unnamed protein product [Linum trigynum]|uniref:RNase H type-1 domain-containing protein n=1 Tax=Linum trigynum TaxID=586398 RepID=A0AAV2CEF3_9ROSI